MRELSLVLGLLAGSMGGVEEPRKPSSLMRDFMSLNSFEGECVTCSGGGCCARGKGLGVLEIEYD